MLTFKSAQILGFVSLLSLILAYAWVDALSYMLSW